MRDDTESQSSQEHQATALKLCRSGKSRSHFLPEIGYYWLISHRPRAIKDKRSQAHQYKMRQELSSFAKIRVNGIWFFLPFKFLIFSYKTNDVARRDLKFRGGVTGGL